MFTAERLERCGHACLTNRVGWLEGGRIGAARKPEMGKIENIQGSCVALSGHLKWFFGGCITQWDTVLLVTLCVFFFYKNFM